MGSQLGHTRDGVLRKTDTAVLRQALGYSPGVVDANKHSLTPSNTYVRGEVPDLTRGDIV
jgi:hypothetical protein